MGLESGDGLYAERGTGVVGGGWGWGGDEANFYLVSATH